MSDRVGQQLGNYRLLHLVGRGSFAEVYLGEHLHLGTQAAIKVLYANRDMVNRPPVSSCNSNLKERHPHPREWGAFICQGDPGSLTPSSGDNCSESILVSGATTDI